MDNLFRNKYRIPSARASWWDYGWAAAYFVTICTQNRQCFFGDVVDGKMCLSEIGIIAENEWIKTPQIRPDMHLELGAFVVMPNHFHGIIVIGENEFNLEHRRDAMHRVSTTATHRVSTTATQTENKNSFAPQSKNLASIVRGFKSSITKHARQIHADFAWQSRYHDHIIRNDQSYTTISNYIINNPSRWNEDKFYAL